MLLKVGVEPRPAPHLFDVGLGAVVPGNSVNNSTDTLWFNFSGLFKTKDRLYFINANSFIKKAFTSYFLNTQANFSEQPGTAIFDIKEAFIPRWHVASSTQSKELSLIHI